MSESEIRFATIPEFRGYRFGSDGSVWCCLKRVSAGCCKGTRSIETAVWRRRKLCPHRDGYLTVGLSVGGKRVYRFVHTLMLMAFVGPRPEGMHACHNDGCRTNNVIDNLRWDTPSANKQDAIRHGTAARGERVRKSNLTEADVRSIRAEHASGTAGYAAIARRYGLADYAVKCIVLRRTWAHVV